MLTNYSKINEKLVQTCKTYDRSRDDVTLIAVSKTVDLPAVQDAIDQGATDFGENRPEELVRKSEAFPGYNWHFIGNIQSRQIKKIVPHACLIHSLDKIEHAHKIDSVAAEIGKIQKVLVEVNVSGEASKGGVKPKDLPAFLEECKTLKNIEVVGLMTMAPIHDEAHAELPHPKTVFKLTKKLLEDSKPLMGENFCQLSMGMTDDWMDAVAESSTFVRIGRAIFDPNLK